MAIGAGARNGTFRKDYISLSLNCFDYDLRAVLLAEETKSTSSWR